MCVKLIHPKVKEIRINLPKVSSIAECQLDMDAEFLTLDFKSKVYNRLKIPLLILKEKYSLRPESIEAKFIKKTSILRVKIPLEAKCWELGGLVNEWYSSVPIS